MALLVLRWPPFVSNEAVVPNISAGVACKCKVDNSLVQIKAFDARDRRTTRLSCVQTSWNKFIRRTDLAKLPFNFGANSSGLNGGIMSNQKCCLKCIGIDQSLPSVLQWCSVANQQGPSTSKRCLTAADLCQWRSIVLVDRWLCSCRDVVCFTRAWRCVLWTNCFLASCWSEHFCVPSTTQIVPCAAGVSAQPESVRCRSRARDGEREDERVQRHVEFCVCTASLEWA